MAAENPNPIVNRLRPSLTLGVAQFIIILLVGVFARVWEFSSLPPGLTVDEASIGVEAYDLYKFGIDRNGFSYPVNFVAWGSMQQNVLYAYLLIPFIVLGELSPFFIRLPMLISGILSLPLIYFVGRKLGEERFGLLCMFLVAISPWHIISSRWAIEYNIFPSVFLLGFSAMLATEKNNHWFVLACVAFGISLYAYATSYAAIPVFLALSVPVLLHNKRVGPATAAIGLAAFVVLAFPIFLYVIINLFKLDTIHLGLISIPRVPGEARFQYMTAIFSNMPLKALVENIAIMFKLLWQQSDGLSLSNVEPFGYFYKVTFPLALAGLLPVIPHRDKHNSPEKWLLLAWLIAALSIGVLLPVSLTRFNLIFTPLIICIAFFLVELDKYVKYSLLLSIISLSVGFIFFTLSYHGEEYKRVASGAFNAGMIPAVEYAGEMTDGEVCVTESVYYAYIYVLYVQKPDPQEYVHRMEWVYLGDSTPPMRTPKRLGQFTFVGPSCSNIKETSYILSLKEPEPVLGVQYREKQFSKFIVLIPKR